MPFSFPGRLGRSPISEDTLNAPLLLFVFCLGSFPSITVRTLREMVGLVGSGIYLGGRFVLGSGRTCPHDFRFLGCFFSVDAGSPSAAGVERLSSVRVEATEVALADGVAPRAEGTASFLKSVIKVGGDMTTWGSRVLGVGVVGVEKREGYISPGADNSESVGDVLKVLPEGVCSFQDAILHDLVAARCCQLVLFEVIWKACRLDVWPLQ